MPHWGIVPTEQETVRAGRGRGAGRGGGAGRPAAVRRRRRPLTEIPARMLLRYLDALAAGIAVDPAGVPRRRCAAAIRRLGGVAGGDVGRVGAGRGAERRRGRAARRDRRQLRPARPAAAAEPTAAESARLAGVAAAELVVNGAGLHEVAGAAAGVAMNGWQIGLPDDPVDRIEYRARGLVGLRAGRAGAGDPGPGTARRAGELRRAARGEPRPAVPGRDHLHDGPGRRPRSARWRPTWPAWPPRSRSGRAASGRGFTCTPTGPVTSSGRSTPTAHRSTCMITDRD